MDADSAWEIGYISHMSEPAPDDFQLPEDPGEQMAWLANFAEKLPLYAEKLNIPPEMLAKVQDAYEKALVEKDRADTAALRQVEQRLCAVPDGWPAPKTLRELMREVRSFPEPVRTKMMQEVERWTAAIERSRSPHLMPVLRGEVDAEHLIVRFTPLPEPCGWVRLYYRPRGTKAWDLLMIGKMDYYLHTAPEYREEGENWEGGLEFTALGHLTHDDPAVGYGEAWGAPSAVLSMDWSAKS